jgi:hypothetical protein
MSSQPPPDEVTSTTTDLDYAHLRLTHVMGGEHGFVRLVRPGPNVAPARTVDATECYIDYDRDGKVIGINWTVLP